MNQLRPIGTEFTQANIVWKIVNHVHITGDNKLHEEIRAVREVSI
jgi:hypothetical protein